MLAPSLPFRCLIVGCGGTLSEHRAGTVNIRGKALSVGKMRCRPSRSSEEAKQTTPVLEGGVGSNPDTTSSRSTLPLCTPTLVHTRERFGLRTAKFFK